MTENPTQSASTAARLVGALGVLFVHFVALFLVIVELCVIVPSFVEYFAELEFELPLMTQQLFRLSDLLVNYWYVFVSVAVIADAAMVMTLAFVFYKQRWLLSAYSHLCLLAAMILLAWIGFTLGMPFIQSDPVELGI